MNDMLVSKFRWFNIRLGNKKGKKWTSELLAFFNSLKLFCYLNFSHINVLKCIKNSIINTYVFIKNKTLPIQLKTFSILCSPCFMAEVITLLNLVLFVPMLFFLSRLEFPIHCLVGTLPTPSFWGPRKTFS